MPTVSYFERQEYWERRLARALGKLLSGQLSRLLEILGTPPAFERLTPEFFDRHQAELQGLLTPELERVFVDRVSEWIVGSPAIGVDWAQANQGAADWARRYTFDLVKELRSYSEKGWFQLSQQQRDLIRELQESVAEFYENPENLAQLRERLGRYFGPVRAENIATTEVTRASASGDEEVYRQLGLAPLAFRPPAHPRCRCSTAIERLPGGEWVTVWLTRMDEIVCAQPLMTPWGTVNGCGDLGAGGGRVLNEGPYLGMTLSDARAMAEQHATGNISSGEGA